MKPTKDSLKEELLYRIECINNADLGELTPLFKYEKSIYEEIIRLIDLFKDRQGAEEFEISKYTPIKDYITKEPLKIGDKVKDFSSDRNGILCFEEYTNRYGIRNEFNQCNYPNSFIKIEENYDYNVNDSKVECRANPHKKKW